jgi:hypothetical protein
VTASLAYHATLATVGLALWIWGTSMAAITLERRKRLPRLIEAIGKLRPPNSLEPQRRWQAIVVLVVSLFVPAGLASMLRQGDHEIAVYVVLALGLLVVIAWTILLVAILLKSPLNE